MSSVDLEPREFAPIVRKTTYRGSPAWEVDIRRWPQVAKAIGTPLRKRFSDPDKARSYYRRLIVAAAAGAPVNPIQLPVRPFFDRYLRWIEKKSPSRGTHNAYRWGLGALQRYLDAVGLVDVSQVSRAVLQGFIEHETGRVAPTTLQTEMSVVRACFNWGIRAGLIADNPAARMVPRAQAPERRALTKGERHKLMTAEGPDADYWRVYLLTGMRRAELLHLTVDRVHLDTPAPFVAVLGKGLRKRNLPLEGLALEIFARLLRRAREANTLRVCPVSGRSINTHWLRDRKRLELPDDRAMMGPGRGWRRVTGASGPATSAA